MDVSRTRRLKFIESVDGMTIEARRAKIDFTALTTISPNNT